MKQYTTPEQTAELIELGFERPKFEVETQMCNMKGQPLLRLYGAEKEVEL